MKRYCLILSLIAVIFSISLVSAEELEERLVKELTSIDENIRSYFPRWKVCETDLQIQIHQAFILYGIDKSQLNMQQIEILSAPRSSSYDAFDILLISCGNASMSSVELESHMPRLLDILSTRRSYTGKGLVGERDYCYQDIPVEVPVTSSQAQAIVNYLEPTNVTHAFTVSLFEQTIKIGNSGFWLQNKVGTDQIGYPFWTSGESKILLKRPLYANTDIYTRGRIPYLLSLYVGGGYRITGGINDQHSVLSWVAGRYLNTGPGGKIVAGLDFHLPVMPEFGLHTNVEIPLRKLQDEGIDRTTYATYYSSEVQFMEDSPRRGEFVINGVAPISRSSGQITLFYNWWLNDANPENYFKIDLGISYSEIREVACFDSLAYHFFTFYDVEGLKTYKPNEFADWVYLKLEYRNQATWPFGVSLQFSNQILLARAYFPLFGNWLYIEGKYATPLRSLRPYETKNFFMFSPVLRLTI